MTEHQLSSEYVPSSPRLVKGSCSCGDWALVHVDPEQVRGMHDVHVLIMRFAPEAS